MKILITGAFGQLGEILSEKLNKFNEVIKTGIKLPEGETGMNQVQVPPFGLILRQD